MVGIFLLLLCFDITLAQQNDCLFTFETIKECHPCQSLFEPAGSRSRQFIVTRPALPGGTCQHANNTIVDELCMVQKIVLGLFRGFLIFPINLSFVVYSLSLLGPTRVPSRPERPSALAWLGYSSSSGCNLSVDIWLPHRTSVSIRIPETRRC